MRSLMMAAAAAATLAMSLSSAEAQSRTRVGGLTCDLAPSVGLVLGSQQDARCIFRPARGKPERYHARLSRLGVDLGVKEGGRLYWAVLAHSAITPPRSLVGDYVGASGQAAFGIGAGANVLVGGSGRSISLQPVSVSAQRGVNVAAGVASLSLR